MAASCAGAGFTMPGFGPGPIAAGGTGGPAGSRVMGKGVGRAVTLKVRGQAGMARQATAGEPWAARPGRPGSVLTARRPCFPDTAPHRRRPAGELRRPRISSGDAGKLVAGGCSTAALEARMLKTVIIWTFITVAGFYL